MFDLLNRLHVLSAASLFILASSARAEEHLMAAGGQRPLPAQISFNAHIRPLMSNTCFVCHGPDEDENQSAFRIDSFEAATSTLPSDDELVGIRPNDPEGSEVYRRIMGQDDVEPMPPADFRHQLSDYDKALFRKWIEQGAKYEQHWSYAPIVRPAVPVLTEHQDKVNNPIDAFVLARLEEEGIKPSELADKATLLRRLSLDLIGLPPTVEELNEFLADDQEGAYDRQVERLLASSHFGERMASSWLDLVRFADTVGFHGDQNQRIFPYRDYVIDAFNDNKPFDVFTREQIAGDLLPDPTPEQLVATGVLRLNMVTREGGAQPNEYLAKSKADRVRALGTAWMGVTLGCCECHNHKYDPFTAKDFYSLGAFFDDLRQWGVYSDYGYTPNKDLAGFNNDFPFPPETRVDSESALTEIEMLQRERDARLFDELGGDALESDDFKQWAATLASQLKSHADGWLPVDVSQISTTGETKYQQLDDRSVLLQGKSKGNESISLTAKVDQPTTINSIRLEVLPDEHHGGNVGRGDEGRFSVSLAAKLHRHEASQSAAPKLVRPRFVRVELPGKNKILSLAEVQVFAEDASGKLENIATGGKATQVSTYRDGEAQHAIDGNTDGDYKSHSVTHNQAQNDPWWEVDLGDAYKVSKISLWNRTDGNYASRLANYRVVLLGAEREELLVLKPGTPSPSLELSIPDQSTADSSQELSFAWIEADLQNPSRYQSGHELRSLVQPWRSGPIPWQFPANETKQTHTAVYHLAKPVTIQTGDELVVRLDSDDVGRVRLAVTGVGHAIAGWPAAGDRLLTALETSEAKRSEEHRQTLLSAYHRSTLPIDKQVATSRYYRDRILELHSGSAMSLIAQAVPEDKIPISRVRPRGNWQDESGELAPPAVPHFLPQPPEDGSSRRLTRLDLADWLTSRSNPLTSRHFVNRTWKQFFGVGLSSKLDDLGNQGEWPSHPGLLEWLAAEFIESGWDVKQLIRLMVHSRTYQQAAAVRSDLGEVDPYNRLLAQQSARRLEAEAVRDNALAIAGLLRTDYVGGPSIFPYQPDGHYANIQFPDRAYDANRDYRQYRRGVYMHWQRTFLHPMLVNFDAPSRDECAADRTLSNSPQQALTLLNDPSFVEAARAMATQLLSDHPQGSFDEILNVAFRKAVARDANERERETLQALYQGQLDYFRSQKADAEQFVKVGNLPVDETTDKAVLAAWSQVCRVILNLHETITRY
ncbi:MAG: DUF1553 domain-containing protein [Planctomycetaceae bacterium]